MGKQDRRSDSKTADSGVGRQWHYPDREEHPDEEIYIYAPWCKSCGICYSLCPKSVLEADKAGRPVVARPEDCIVCHLCEMLCPDMAITVHKERPAAKKDKDAEAAGAAGENGDD